MHTTHLQPPILRVFFADQTPDPRKNESKKENKKEEMNEFIVIIYQQVTKKRIHTQ